jgi:homoserine dehydrogenase
MSAGSLVVLKFGSSVLRSEADLSRVAAEIKRYTDRGCRVVAVVSAIGKSTEQLIERALSLAFAPAASAAPAEAAFAALLATGEATSAALVGLALDRINVPFSVLCAGRVGPFTRGPQLDAEPCALDAGAIKRALDKRPVAILPGFVGRDGEGHFSLLGRGGSDLTALFVAHSLGADRCRLLKDVDGIYEHDPARHGRVRPRRYASLDWAGALRLNDSILQRKASQFAYRHRVAFEVASCGGHAGTFVGATTTILATAERSIAEGGLAS